MASNIGIKIANGEFYPILKENSSIKKRLILSTAHDNQSSTQIDLYRSPKSVMTDAQYIGSVVVENIKPRPKGEPSIELVISSKSNGEIVADAIDLDTSSSAEHHVLTVSLKSLDETARDMEINDFELESNEEPPTGLYKSAIKKRKKQKSRSLAWLFILILLIALGLFAGWLFYLGGMEIVSSKVTELDIKGKAQSVLAKLPKPASKPAVQTAPEPVVQAAPEPVKPPEPAPEPVKPAEPAAQTPEPTPVIAAPAAAPAPRAQTSQRRPPAPVASYNVPATIPREGVNYVIRWGDTLWDISEAFYRDPWQYPRIARHNNIRNPNYIISGRTIRIPPKN